MIDHISLAVLRAVAAPLIVRVPLVVAALVNVIGPVDLIDAVDDQGPRPPQKKRGARFEHLASSNDFPALGNYGEGGCGAGVPSVSALSSLNSTRRFLARTAFSLPPFRPVGSMSGTVDP